uniref:Uncharacterized protein n=1 Tax=Caenorhabditis japonica TaxID=281687 RepID=A0A8R1ETR1_CAEJA
MTTLSQIQRARNETIACITAPDVMIERPNRADATGPSVFRTSLDLTSDLIIAVIVKNMGGYLIASPALREYCADDRGDLFTLLVNEFSYDYLLQTYTKISELHVGDVISVETIFRRQGYTPAQWSPVPLPIDRVRETFFVVGRFAVWKRNETKPQPIVPVGGFLHGHKVPVVLFGSTKLVMVKPSLLRRQGRGQLFATAFIPEVQPGQVLRSIRPGLPTSDVLLRTSAVGCQWQLNPILLDFATGSPDVIRDLDTSPMTFSHGLQPGVDTHAQAYSSTFGVYGMVALQAKRTDLRHFRADVINVESIEGRGTFIKFALHTENQTTSSRLWKKGTPLTVELPDGECLRMTVVVVEHEPRRTRLSARLLSPYSNIYNIHSVVIRQKPTERGDMARLAPRLRNIPEVSEINNAMRTLAAVSGAGALPALEPFPVDHENLTMGEFVLSEQQASIIGTLSLNYFTALAVNCGPGTGKTTTLALAVLSRIENTPSCSLMTAMSNSAVTATVKALFKTDKQRKCKAVRLISSQNRASTEHEHRTPLDFPIIWPEFFFGLVTQFDQRHEPLYRDIVDATIYLVRCGKIFRRSLKRSDLRTSAGSKPVKTLLVLFYDLFKPDLVIGTCASVRSSYGQPGMSRFADQVELLLLDEASQLPRYAFTAICHTFPRARPVLLGDVHQLDPYEDPDLPGSLSSYAVGNVLDDASTLGRCPVLPLLRVHRCPKPIT